MYAYAALVMMASAAAMMAATLPPSSSVADDARIAAETMARLHQEARSLCSVPGACPHGAVPLAAAGGAASAITVRSNGAGMLVTAWVPPEGSNWARVPREAINARLLEMERRMKVSRPGPYQDGFSVGGLPVPAAIGGLTLSSRQPVIAARF